jgi:hypothetical protein
MLKYPSHPLRTFQANAEVEYAFSVKPATIGPQPTTIKVDVIGSFEGGDPTMVTTVSVCVLDQNQIPGSPFVSSPFTLTVDVIPGAVYQVVAEASGGGCISIVTEGICCTPASRYSGTYTSTIDPYVTVDPSMAGDYDLTLGSSLAPRCRAQCPKPQPGE